MATKKKMLLSSAGTAAAGSAGLDITDVFSTYLYSGTGTDFARTIVNGIDLTEGGMVWTKSRTNTYNNTIGDTASGTGLYLYTNTTVGHTDSSDAFISSFNSDGYKFGSTSGGFSAGVYNASGQDYVSWTFRKAPKFFTICEWTGNSTAGRTISHDLGSVPGMIIVKRTDTSGSWIVYHRGLNNGSSPEDYGIILNTAAGQSDQSLYWNDTAPSSTNFTLGSASTVNANGGTYVAYLFAHHPNDGSETGFGTDGDSPVISCGYYTGNGSDKTTIDVGFEAQWVFLKRSDGSTDWWILDSMRGLPVRQISSQYLEANTTNAEAASSQVFGDNQGFMVDDGDYNTSGQKYIYMTVRRGPLSVIEDATELFHTQVQSNGNTYSVGFPTDLILLNKRGGSTANTYVGSRLTGDTKKLSTSTTAAEATYSSYWAFDLQNSFDQGASTAAPWVGYHWKRAPGYFDAVAYSGSNSAKTVGHNLTVTPEMMWVKSRSNNNRWAVFHKDMGPTKRAFLDLTQAFDTGSGIWNNTAPTSSVFTVGTDSNTNYNGYTFISYLFASAPGVSKISSYTGNGSSQTIGCGFTAGARFILIKRNDAVGDWYIWDSARGIVSANSPHLSLNSTAAEVTSNDSCLLYTSDAADE